MLKDSVIEHLEKILRRLTDQLNFWTAKRAELEKGIVSSSGEIRSSLSSQCAQRDVEISALKKRIDELKESIKDAEKDMPRRDMERKRADELEIKIQENAKKAVALVEQLRQMEAEAFSLRKQKNEALDMANATAKELKFRHEEQMEILEKQRQEKISMAEASLLGAELELASAKKEGQPFEIIAERERLVSAYKINLEQVMEAVQ